MRQIIENERLIYKCCKLYYEDMMTQQKISDQLGISRVSVGKMLSLGRERGVVLIQVVSPDTLTYNRLSQNLEQMYGLKEVVVVENDPLGTAYDDQNAMSAATLRLLEHYLHPGDTVGVSMGVTLHNICQGQRPEGEPIDCTFVPIVGGIQNLNLRNKNLFIHANRIAADFARIFGGKYAEFFAPAIFSNPEVLAGLWDEASMHEIRSYYERLNMVIIGIGIPRRFSSTVTTAGYMSTEEFSEMVSLGAVGDLALQFFDIHGESGQFHSFNRRVAGLPLERFHTVDSRLGIAGGKNKAEAVLGAIRGSYINMLVTDVECAQELLKMGEAV